MMIVVPQVMNSMNITPAFRITGGSLTHLQFFGCGSSLVFPLSNNLFCLRNQIVHTCLLPVILDSS